MLIISGCQVSMNAPNVTHLLFADDSFLFFKPTKDEALSVKRILNKYEVESGQAMNYQKSIVFLVLMYEQINMKRLKQFWRSVMIYKKVNI